MKLLSGSLAQLLLNIYSSRHWLSTLTFLFVYLLHSHPIRSLLFTMPSYMTIVVLALAASNVSVALSAPIHYSREVPWQSLSLREDPLAPPSPLSGHPVQPRNPLARAPEETSEKAAVKGKGLLGKIGSYTSKGLVGAVAALTFVAILKALPGNHPPATSPTTSTSPTSSTSQNGQNDQYGPYQNGQNDQYGPYQNGQNDQYGSYQNGQNDQYRPYQNQRRAVDHAALADFLEAKPRLISDNDT